MAALAQRNPQVKLRIVDIVEWSSPVAAQFAIQRLPTVWLYRDGRLVTKDSKSALEQLSALK